MTMADNDDGRRAAPFIALHHQPSGHGRPISDPARSQRVHASALSRDSVISHPFSPKISSPPSPSSVVSSAIRHHSRHAESQQTSQHSVTYPPRARLDLEKQNVLPQSPQPRTFISISNPDVVIRTSGQRPNDDTPESDALKILVCLDQSTIPRSIRDDAANTILAISLRTMCHLLVRNHVMDCGRPPHQRHPAAPAFLQLPPHL
jgi:hypothetical protein